MPFVTPDDVKAVQDQIAAEVIELGNAVPLTMPPLDDATLAAWHAIRTRALNFVGESPSWLHTAAQMDAGQAILRDLGPWYDRLRAKGAPVGPTPSPPPGQADLFGSLGDIAKVVLAIIVIEEFARH